VLAALDAAVARLAPPPLAGPVDVEAALARVTARRDTEAATVLPLRRPATGPRVTADRAPARRWLTGGLAAAAAVGALAIGLTNRDPDADAPAAHVARTYSTPVGARDSVRLPDGTRVVLAPGSRLDVAADYGGAGRQVTLEGAAWFSVQHDAARPFTVRAGPATVRDIGTVFSVRTDGVDDGAGVAVAVTEGSVALAAAAAPPGDTGVVLAAGDRGVLPAGGRAVAERGAATAEDAAWTRGRLAYTGAPLALVRADLRRWYGVDLQVPDSALAARRLTARFDGDSVGRVLDVIALAVGARVERTGNTAVLLPAGASPAPPR